MQNIVNTGQGIFTGLVNFGGWLYQGLVDAFKWIWEGFRWIGEQFRRGFEAIASYFYNAYVFIAQNLFSVGQWIWAGIQGFANQVINGLAYIGKRIYDFFTGIGTTLYNAITSFKSSIDEWFFNIISTLRSKIKASIMFSVSTHIAWRSMENIPEGKLVSGLVGLVLSPVLGYFMSELVNSLLPTPSSPVSPIPTIPSVTMPSLVLEEKYPVPPSPTAPGVLAVGVGVTPEESVIYMSTVDKMVIVLTVTAEATATTIGSSDREAGVTATVETEPIS